MGTPFDFFSPKSWPADRERQHRGSRPTACLACQRRCDGAAFAPYDREWWHFTLRGEPFPDTYFDFPVR